MSAGELPPTPRQREILALVAAGQRNGQIAARLGISVQTVATLLYDVYRRLGVAREGGVQNDAPRTQAAIWHYREVARERAAGRR
jgi:DNA-binding CsgD family transcriptional regulator